MMMTTTVHFIEELQVAGRLSFTTDEVVAVLGKSLIAVRAQIRRLEAKGQIATPYRGFHVVVPPSFRRLACLPADYFLSALMSHLSEPYYVGLMSAAAYYGAAHQSPMAFQVIVRKKRRRIVCGGVCIDFIARHDMEETLTRERKVPTGFIRVASPAATALEIVGYPQQSGSLDNVVTILGELSESIQVEELAIEARRAPVAWVQRLGYFLARIEALDLAAQLDGVLAERRHFLVPLAPWQGITGAPRDRRWQVAVNATVESDL